MPFPLNFTHREFADQTRMPAASLARALSEMYEAFALIEERKFPSVYERFDKASKKLDDAIVQMKELEQVDKRWEIKDDPVFDALLTELTELTGFVPSGDRSIIDFMISEMHGIKALISRYAAPNGERDLPSRLPEENVPQDVEDQAHMIRNILAPALKLQQVGLIVTQISTVTSARSL